VAGRDVINILCITQWILTQAPRQGKPLASLAAGPGVFWLVSARADSSAPRRFTGMMKFAGSHIAGTWWNRYLSNQQAGEARCRAGAERARTGGR
jgi:hypothetical protein